MTKTVATEGRNKEPFFIVAIAAVIVGSLGLTIYQIMGPRIDTPKEIHLQCIDRECNHAFTLPVADPRLNTVRVPGPGPVSLGIQCPKCGKPDTAVRQSMCPNCKKFYLPEFARYRGDEIMPPEAAENKCPYCGTDIAQWYKDHGGKK